MTSPASAASAAIKRVGQRRAFTLVEILVTIGIIAALVGLLLPALSKARKIAFVKRQASDLQAIAAALEEYKHDFGDYPRVEFTPGINNATNRPEPPTGAQVLCWALIGPAGLNEPNGGTTPANEHAIQDGADGPGFRTRTSLVAGKNVASGRVFGPYLVADKFRIGDPANPTATSDPTKALLWTLLDSNNKPILYAPASLKNLNPHNANAFIGQTTATSPVPSVLPQSALQTFIWDLTDILGDVTTGSNNPVDDTGVKLFGRLADTSPTLAPGYRLSSMLGDRGGQGVNNPGAPDGRITDSETAATTGPYLLWTAGYDQKFGPDPEPTSSKPLTAKDIANCDDVTNFNQ